MNRFWQCPDCGGILEKNEVTLQVASDVAGLAGTATCSFCSSSQSATEVYSGNFDFAESDDFIYRMGADQGNVSFDQTRMRWQYKGRIVALKSDCSAPIISPSPIIIIPLTNLTISLPNFPTGAKPLELVLIPSGTFIMGSPNNEQDRYKEEGPQHKVTITKQFYLGKYEVTQAQWQAVMGYNPSLSKGDNNPVEMVSWNDCQNFIQKLNKLGRGIFRLPNFIRKLNKLDHGTFRLPTEAEWEYACRAGTTTRYYWGDDPNYTDIYEYAWYAGNSNREKTHEVGTKLPNAFGLFDMSGNVWEWCQDWYGNYSNIDQVDPKGQQTGSYRVLRGGSWFNVARSSRSAIRLNNKPDYRSDNRGLRLVRIP